MKVLGINGSHRRGRNTAAMLKMVLDQAAADGAETELIELLDYRIRPCTACNRCLTRSFCQIKDDMNIIGDKILEADAVVLGSPVYSLNVSGRMKVFMDRTRWMHLNENLLFGKLGAAVVHAGLRNGGQELVQQIMESYMLSLGMVVVTCQVEHGYHNIGAAGTLFEGLQGEQMQWRRGVLDDPLAVLTCHKLGKNLVRMFAKFKQS